MEPIGCPETSAASYQSTLPVTPQTADLVYSAAKAWTFSFLLISFQRFGLRRIPVKYKTISYIPEVHIYIYGMYVIPFANELMVEYKNQSAVNKSCVFLTTQALVEEHPVALT
jgi:hypothetical protein